MATVETKLDLNLSMHATKFDLKSATGVDILKYVKESDLASLIRNQINQKKYQSSLSTLKRKLDKSDIDKLKPVPFEFKKINELVNKIRFKKRCVR